ncbi:MAG: serine hydrolase domain-containing protein [Acidimicrobiia bacterium]|nr:serine hydrolase domain-containing protein [Acidimicrobiia bacterium]
MTLTPIGRPEASPLAPTDAETEPLSDEPSMLAPRPGRDRRLLVGVGLMVASALWLVVACGPRGDSVDTYVGLTMSQEELSEFVERRMGELEIPGLSLAVINNGEVVHSEHFGHADVERNVPVTDETIFEAGSLSKSVFAQFVMTFVEAGELDLDRPLFEYLPHPDVSQPDLAEQITARMVLSHTAGFPNWRDDPDGSLPIAFEPGTAFEYSGEGYQYLALVLLEITGTDWHGLESLFNDRIAEPLGLDRMTFVPSDVVVSDKAAPYDEDGIKIDWRSDPRAVADLDIFIAPASLHADTTDFTRWMIGVMHGEVLREESYEELFTRHSSTPSEELGLSYTLGFYEPHIPFTDIFGHGGNNHGFTSFFMLDPVDDWGFVVLTNSEFGDEFGEELFIRLFAGPSIPRIVVTVISVVVLTLSFLVVGARLLRRRPIEHT